LVEVSVVRRVSALCLLSLALLASGCGNDSPTAPTPPPTPTRIITLEGVLAFGNVGIGATESRIIRIFNLGTEALTITGMTSAGAGTVFSADWTQGTIAPGSNQTVTFRFTPTAAQSYNGTLTVNGNQTSGTNTMAITAAGVFPPRPNFSRSGVGDTVFDMPLDVARIRVVGTYNGSSQNFIMRIGGRLIVNEIIGTCCGNVPRYEGTLLTGGGGLVEIRSSSGVSWLIEEIR
jgi:hypothetical protein